MELDIEQTIHDTREAGLNALEGIVTGKLSTEESGEIIKKLDTATKVVEKELKSKVKTAKKSTLTEYDSRGFKATKHTGLKIHKSEDKFLFDVMLEGKRYRNVYKITAKNLSIKDKIKTAYKALEEWVTDTVHAKTITANPNSTVNDYYENLKDNTKWSEDTTKRYDLYYAKYIQDTLGKKKIKDVKPQHFTEYNKTIKHLSLAMQKKSYELLKPLFNLAVEDEIIVKTPIKTSHVPKRDQQSEKKVIINAVEKYKIIYKSINQLFNSNDIVVISKTKSIQCNVNPHHLAIFLLGFHGRRLNEVVTLRWEDIDFPNNQYKIRKEVSKIGQDMIYTLPQDVKKSLEQFADRFGDVFRIREVKRHYKTIRAISGIEEYTYHWMRNLAVSALSASGVPTVELSAMLGHSDINTLNKYLSLQRSSATANTANASQRLLS